MSTELTTPNMTTLLEGINEPFSDLTGVTLFNDIIENCLMLGENQSHPMSELINIETQTTGPHTTDTFTFLVGRLSQLASSMDLGETYEVMYLALIESDSDVSPAELETASRIKAKIIEAWDVLNPPPS